MRRVMKLLSLMLLGVMALWALSIVPAPAFGQAAYNVDSDSGKITSSGSTWTHYNVKGELNLTFELLINGSPTSSTITIQGCGRGNSAAYGQTVGVNGLAANNPTCDTLDTYTGNANSNRKLTGLYNSYVVTATWSGGTSPAVQINEYGTSASTPANSTPPVTPSGATCIGTICSFSPTQLGANAMTLPASSTSANTNIVDMRGVKEMNLIANCTQGPYSVGFVEYAEDGTTSVNGVNAITSVAAAVTTEVWIGSESSISAIAGTVSNAVKLPQRAMAFNFVNSSATPGTCTARLLLQY